MILLLKLCLQSYAFLLLVKLQDNQNMQSSLGWGIAQLKYWKNYPWQTKTNFELIGSKSSHRAKKMKIYRCFFRDIGPHRSKVGPNGQILIFELQNPYPYETKVFGSY